MCVLSPTICVTVQLSVEYSVSAYYYVPPLILDFAIV